MTPYTPARLHEIATALEDDDHSIENIEAAQALASFADLLEQTCETCRFAGPVLSRHLEAVQRTCRFLESGEVNPILALETRSIRVPLTLHGRPFSCAGWQPKDPGGDQ